MTLYDWSSKQIPNDCNWLVTGDDGRTFAFVGEPTKEHKGRQGEWAEHLFSIEIDALGRRHGWLSYGTWVTGLDVPHLIGIKEKRPLIYFGNEAPQ